MASHFQQARLARNVGAQLAPTQAGRSRAASLGSRADARLPRPAPISGGDSERADRSAAIGAKRRVACKSAPAATRCCATTPHNTFPLSPSFSLALVEIIVSNLNPFRRVQKVKPRSAAANCSRAPQDTRRKKKKKRCIVSPASALNVAAADRRSASLLITQQRARRKACRLRRNNSRTQASCCARNGGQLWSFETGRGGFVCVCECRGALVRRSGEFVALANGKLARSLALASRQPRKTCPGQISERSLII